VRGVRVVDAGRVVTATVSASLNRGLHLVGKFFGAERRTQVADAMGYFGG